MYISFIRAISVLFAVTICLNRFTMASLATKRLICELRELRQEECPEFAVEVEDYILTWKVVLFGPCDSVYTSGQCNPSVTVMLAIPADSYIQALLEFSTSCLRHHSYTSPLVYYIQICMRYVRIFKILCLSRILSLR